MIREKSVIREFVTSYQMRDYIDIPLTLEINPLCFRDQGTELADLPSLQRLRYRYEKMECLMEFGVVTKRWFVYRYSGVVI